MKKLLTALALSVMMALPSGASSIAIAQSAPPQIQEIRDHRGHYRHRNYGRPRHYRGPRHYGPRRHYRRDHSWVAPFAFGLGAAIIITEAERRARQNHIEWCSRRYRSYDIETNTWVDFDGNIRVCRSPYR